ncbi:MAG: MopE-related protein [Polyangiales bacterium]
MPEGDSSSRMDAVVDDRSTAMPDRNVPPVDTGVMARCTSAAECDDGIACTEDGCGMDGVCTHAAMNDRCNDGRFCNGVESCNATTGCAAGTAPTCDDMNANTTDRCDEGANACRNDPLDNDGDGDPAMSAGGNDCDDNDRTRSSLEREVCNGRDDNCNGMIDEGALNSCGNCDPNCRGVSTGGMGGASFDPGGQRGVDFDPMAGGLLVRANNRMADYLWVPNTAESTVSKWDANMRREIARYRVGLAAGECLGRCCWDNGCNMTSRTVVDGFGNAWIANRGFAMQGTVSKIAADTADCVDRNGNGMIDTSTGPSDVRPFGADECVVLNVPVGPSNATLRAIAVDRGDAMFPEGYVWVGGCNSSAAQPGFKLNPRTGAVLQTVTIPHCAYGAVVAPDGRLWWNGGAFNSSITPMTTTTGAMGTTVTGGGYGITVDADGRLWFSQGNRGYDPRTNSWTTTTGSVSSTGITVDGMNRVWGVVGNNLVNWNASAFVAGGAMPAAAFTSRAITPAPSGVSAIGADRAGNIWLATSNAGPLTRFDTATNSFTTHAGPNRVYTYTDFTGAVRRLVIGTGTYTQNYDTNCARPELAQLTWDATTPAGTTLVFAMQTADTMAGLGGAPSTVIATAPMMASPVDVAARLAAAMVTARRFVRLTVTFNPTTMPIASPVLRGMSLAWRCPYSVPTGG